MRGGKKELVEKTQSGNLPDGVVWAKVHMQRGADTRWGRGATCDGKVPGSQGMSEDP